MLATGLSRDGVVQMLRLLLGHIPVDDSALMDALTAVVRIRSAEPESMDCDL